MKFKFGFIGLLLVAIGVAGASNTGAANLFQSEISMHVQDISMLVRSENGNSPWKVADATVTVVHSAGQPVAGATVEGEFTGDTSSVVSGVTDANGQVTLTSPRIKDGMDWVFCVTSILQVSFVYNPAENVETCDFVGTPPPTATATPSPLPTQTPTATVSPLPTQTETGTPTQLPTVTHSPIPTQTETGTPTQPPTTTPSPIPTQTETGTPTQPPPATATITLSPFPTGTPTPAGTPTPTSALPVHVEIVIPVEGATITGISSTEFFAVAWDPLVGTTNGDGIISVHFELIYEATGTLIMTNSVFAPQYCAFGGNGPCNRWQSPPVNPPWNWSTAPNGSYRLRARAVGMDGRVSAWDEHVFTVAKPLATVTATATPTP